MTNPVKDRSGVGLPPKAERRAAGKLAKERHRRAERRNRILKGLGSALAVVAVIGGIAVACGTFRTKTGAQASASASAAAQDPALATKPVVTAGTGDLTDLKVSTIIQGTGAQTKAGQKLSVNYVGVSYKTGKEFDSSWKSGTPEPFSFTLGTGSVIKGWDQGMAGVKVGSRVQLDIPASLAYGESTSGDSPAGPLRFVVDVLSAS